MHDTAELSVAEVAEGVARGDIQLVDVREAHEFAAGHIAGAVNNPLSHFDLDALAAVDAPVVLLCVAGIRSGRALEAAQHAGIAVAGHFGGGMKAWVEDGRPINRG